ncbi:hypothetical protein EVAR_97780_1 [Eumeta japonica]|uniref:Uncharacterized protein n=1 Tax=Eumeta variegata TaxID=151549 RepID=A0A4C2A2T7_EUMVA|nr:hypothetical protein EVAR_97780_1 [Eumeta japonica]
MRAGRGAPRLRRAPPLAITFAVYTARSHLKLSIFSDAGANNEPRPPLAAAYPIKLKLKHPQSDDGVSKLPAPLSDPESNHGQSVFHDNTNKPKHG